MKGGSFLIPHKIKKEGIIMKDEKEFYDEISDWDFSKYEIETECLTKWELYDELKMLANKDSKILDLGTGGGEKLLEFFPEAKEILGTDFSEGMIETAKKNLVKSGRSNITFRLMDNLKMDVPDNYYDIVVARNTVTDPKQIYRCLKKGGYLLIHGVDREDCWNLKLLFGRGQGFTDTKSMSLVDYENAKSNFYLDSVYIMDGKLEPEFNDDTYNYKVYVPSDTKELKMSFRPQSKYCTGEIEGNENLTNGSVVKINTVDGTGATFTYTFTVVYSNSKVLMVIIIMLHTI